MSEEQSKQWVNEWTWELWRKWGEHETENEEKDDEWVCVYIFVYIYVYIPWPLILVFRVLTIWNHMTLLSWWLLQEEAADWWHHFRSLGSNRWLQFITTESITCQILIKGLPLVELTAHCGDASHPNPSPPPALPSSSSSVVNSSLEQMLKTFTSISVTGEEKQRGARETPCDPSTHRPSPGWL